VRWIANTIEQREQAIAALHEAGIFWPHMCEMFVECAASMPDVSFADIIIIDEVHHLPSESWSLIASRASPEAIIWGLTATPNHEDGERNAILEKMFPHRFVIEREALIAAGHLQEGKVFMHDVDVPGEFNLEIEKAVVLETRRRVVRFPLVSPAEHRRRAQWQITQEYIQKNEKRNDKIVALCAEATLEGRSTLVLVHSIEHGESLVARISGSVLVHSKVGAKARRELIQGFREGKLLVLGATSLADEGLDVPIAQNLVLAAGGRSSGKLEQRAGRILRPYVGKRAGVINDFLDRGSLFGHAQARARIKTWTKLGYSPEIVGGVLETTEAEPSTELEAEALLEGFEQYK
jgi:superfamily II DNA or RNA helicase